MKKSISILVFILLCSSLVVSQNLKKGNFVGIHVGSIELKPGVTMEQYNDFCMNKMVPAYNKELNGDIVLYIAEGERGVYENSVCRIMVIKSMKVRNKYFPEEGKPSELMKSKLAKLQPLIDQMDKLGTFKEDHYTDYEVKK